MARRGESAAQQRSQRGDGQEQSAVRASATSLKRKADLIKPKRLPRKVDQILNALLARFGFAFRQEARV